MAIDFEDAYSAGVESEEIGAFITTPQAALDKVEAINIQMQQLNVVVESNPKVRPEFKSNWKGFYEGWRKYYDANGPGFSGWASRLWASSYEGALDYEKKLINWYDAVAKEGVAVSNPSAPVVEGEFPWRWVLIGGGLLLGYVLVKEVGKGVGSAVSNVSKAVTQ